jgi:hypothetical protein
VNKPDLQVGMVAVRRADLLGKTLESFSKNLFCHFNVTSCYVNIDPMFGDQHAHDAAVACVQQFFPKAVIRAPETPSFGAAVKWVWSQFSPGLALHLEDDWQLTQPILPQDVLPKLQPGYGAVSLCGNHPKWYKRRPYLWVGQRRRGLFPFGTRKIPAMGTSPKFIQGALAHRLAQMMDPDLDPEKQMLPWINPAFSDIIAANKCGFLDKSGTRQYGVMEELGRAWREARHIEKTVVDGKSIWVVTPK